MAANDDVDAPAGWGRAEADLRWYFESESSLDLASNYGPMVLRMQFGRALPRELASGAIDELRPDARARAARIEAALAGAGPDASAALRLAYGTPRPRELKPFGELAQLVLRSPRALAAHLASGSARPLAAWLGRLPRRALLDVGARQLLDSLNLEGGTTLTQALLDYRAALRRLTPNR